MKILVAEDEEQVRRLVKDILEAAGHQVWVASNGQVAWRLFEDEDFDLIISDNTMPGMLGVELLGNIRQVNPTVKLVLMSGDLNSTGLESVCVRLGAKFVGKPFSLADLKQAI